MIEIKKIAILAGVLLLMLSACAEKSETENSEVGDAPVAISEAKAAVSVDNAFTYPLPPGKTVAAVYVRIENTSSDTQTLNYVHADIAENIEVHRSIYENGMMQMRRINHLSLAPGDALTFEPGGYHLMVFGIYDSLAAGDEFEVVFEFEGGLTLNESVLVKAR